MPRLSSRITTLNDGGSDGWDVFYRARRMRDAGVPVIELTIGDHDIRTDPSILDVMHGAARAGHTGYAAVPGIPALRDAIAERITRRTGVATTRDNILVTAGGQSALFAAHLAACAPGETALLVDPYYTTYPGTIRAAGAVPQAIPTRSADGFVPDAAEVARCAKASGARSLLINSPNNPTGTVYPPQSIAALAEVCAAQDLWLISDEVYDTQVWTGTHQSPRALPGMAARTLVVGSMSKSHAMTGSRIGWIAGPAEAIEALTDLATNTTYGVPGYIQDAALFALRQGPALEEAIAAPYRRRRLLAQDILSRQAAVRLLPPQGAMYLMLDIRATGQSGAAFADALLDTHHIAVMPGESFGLSAAGHVRVAMTLDDARLGAALATLCTFAEGLRDAA